MSEISYQGACSQIIRRALSSDSVLVSIIDKVNARGQIGGTINYNRLTGIHPSGWTILQSRKGEIIIPVMIVIRDGREDHERIGVRAIDIYVITAAREIDCARKTMAAVKNVNIAGSK